MQLADIGNFFRLRFRDFAQSVNFDQQDGRAIERKSGVNVVFDGANRPAVEHLARCRRDSARGNLGHRFGRVVNGIKNGQQSLHGFGIAREFHGDFSDQAKRSFGADEQSRQIVARRIERCAPETHQLAAREHNFKRDNVVRGHAVRQRVRPAGIFGNISADRAGFLARRIGSEMKSEVLHGSAEVGIYHARLHRGALVFSVNFNDAFHARKGNDDPAVPRDCAAGKASSRAAANDWNLVAIGEPHDFDHIGRGARENHAVRPRYLDRAVVLVEQQVLRLVEDPASAQKLRQIMEKSRVHWCRARVILDSRVRQL